MSKIKPEHKELLDAARSMRLGFDGYCRVLASTRTQVTTTSIVETHGISRKTTTKLMKWMHQLGLVHQTNFVRAVPHAPLTPHWAFGRGSVDASIVAPAKRSKIRPASALLLLATMIDLLSDGTMNNAELADELKMTREQVRRILACMESHKLVHVARWQPNDGGFLLGEWAFSKTGSEKNAPRPKRPDRLERERERKRIQRQHRSARRSVALILGKIGTPSKSTDTADCA